MKSAQFFAEIEKIEKIKAAACWHTNTDISDDTKNKYAEREIEEMNKLISRYVKRIEIIHETQKGMCKYTMYADDNTELATLWNSKVFVVEFINNLKEI